MQLVLARNESAELSENGAAQATAFSSEGETYFLLYLNQQCVHLFQTY